MSNEFEPGWCLSQLMEELERLQRRSMSYAEVISVWPPTEFSGFTLQQMPEGVEVPPSINVIDLRGWK